MFPRSGHGTVFTNLFNSSGPDKAVGVKVNIPLRNRTAQSLQARAVLEYRQAEMRLEQLYIQVRIQVINGQTRLTTTGLRCKRRWLLANTTSSPTRRK